MPTIPKTVATLLAAAVPAAAQTLTLAAYLDQVRQANPRFASASLLRTAAKDASSRARLLTSPQAFASWQTTEDRSEPLSVASEGDRRASASLKTGLEQRTPFGLSAKLWYQQDNLTVRWDRHPVVPQLPPPPPFSSDKVSLNAAVSIDLLRNLGGHEIRLRQEAARLGAEAEEAGRDHELRAVLVRAESAYWTLALTRRIVEVQEEILGRSRRLHQWTAGQVARGLADPSALLQARSDLEHRTLELEQARANEREARRAFNLLRGLGHDEVPETLETPTEGRFRVPDLPDDPPLRGDVRAALLGDRARSASLRSDRDSLLPQLTLWAASSWSGRDPDDAKALSEAASFDHPTWTLGVDLRTDLDIPARLRSRRGLATEIRSLRHTEEERRLALRSEWAALRGQLEDLRRQRELALRLERTQEAKADLELRRLRTGRSVTAQVLLFEKDLGLSRLQRLGIELRLLQRLAELDLYGDFRSRP